MHGESCIGFTLQLQTDGVLAGEFVLSDWRQAGLNVETAVKRGIYTIQGSLIAERVGKLSDSDMNELDETLRLWLGL